MVAPLAKSAQVEPVTVLGMPLAFVIPVTIAVLILIAIVTIVYICVRDTESCHRADVLRALAGVIRAVGDTAHKILDAIGRWFGGGPPNP